ncbi:MAG: hypothetical protein NTW21_07730 [Verrucomicrobia bacterium]|nr:hypothetical protein [Verrucomicrobiota bacterium]
MIAGKTDHWLHVLHRVKEGRDVFYVTNQNHPGDARGFRFRITATGEPECWDPMRNEITTPPTRRIAADTLEVDLTLAPLESVLLVFRGDGAARPPARVEANTQVVATLEVRRVASAAAPYDGTCDVPATLDLKHSRVYLEAAGITPEAAARVTVNGVDAGGFIGAPLRLGITRLLKPGTNTLRLEPFAPASLRLTVYPANPTARNLLLLG